MLTQLQKLVHAWSDSFLPVTLQGCDETTMKEVQRRHRAQFTGEAAPEITEEAIEYFIDAINGDRQEGHEKQFPFNEKFRTLMFVSASALDGKQRVTLTRTFELEKIPLERWTFEKVRSLFVNIL